MLGLPLGLSLWILILFLVAYFCGYASAKAERGVPMPKLEGVDPWVAAFREYRAAFREESLATVYERWKRYCGERPGVAEYVSRFGVGT